MDTSTIWDQQPQVQQQSDQPTKEEPEKQLNDIMSELPGAPDLAQIEMWKQEFGEVFCSGFSPTEMFVFRSLTRQEFIQIQTVLQQPDNQLSNLEVEEQIVRRCLLWSSDSGNSSLKTKAGSLTTLHEQVMQNSNFMNPALASAMVMKL